MFIRRKKNKSGSVSIHVIQKDNGYKIVRRIGTSTDVHHIERLVLQGKQFIKSLQPPQPYLFPVTSKEDMAIEAFAESS